MKANKIILNNEVLIDLTADTITPSDVKKGVTFHGRDGETYEGTYEAAENTEDICSGEHVIEVVELPTENIDESAVYKVTKRVFSDIIIYDDKEGMMPLGQLLFNLLGSMPLYTEPTKPTDNIKITTDNEIHLYYIADEDDVFVFGDLNNTGVNEWVALSEGLDGTYCGCISDVHQINAEGIYFLIEEQVSFHKYEKKLTDIIWMENEPLSLRREFLAEGATILPNYYIIPTKTTDGIFVSDLDQGLFVNIYFIEDEADLFYYDGQTWYSMSERSEFMNGGAISNISEATTEGCYYALITEWTDLVVPTGISMITENGVYDVADKANVIVNMNTEAVVGVWQFNVGEDGYIDLPFWDTGNYDNVLSHSWSYMGDVSFTCVYNGEVKNFSQIELYGDNSGGGLGLSFHDIDGNEIAVAGNIQGSTYWCGTMSTSIDFGAEPQIIHKKLKELLTYIATPQESIVSDEVLNIIPSAEPQAFNNGVYYRSVACAAVQTQMLDVGVGYNDKTYTPDEGKFYSSVTVRGELTAGKYCGLAFKTLPKTEYVVNEWIDCSGGVLLVLYDNGTCREMALDDDDVIIRGFTSNQAGIYTLTVKYVESTILNETTYTITVREEGDDGPMPTIEEYDGTVVIE